MKKIILSLTALLSVGIASAQSYPKQPDPTVTYVEYTKVAKAEKEPAAKEQSVEVTPAEENTQAQALQPAASVNAATVSENTRNNKARKE